ncbi:hypothetical protein [Paenibacillus alginolyticus]|nr:hypothetical protein [Paenibacillus frigoriresistens]
METQSALCLLYWRQGAKLIFKMYLATMMLLVMVTTAAKPIRQLLN